MQCAQAPQGALPVRAAPPIRVGPVETTQHLLHTDARANTNGYVLTIFSHEHHYSSGASSRPPTSVGSRSASESVCRVVCLLSLAFFFWFAVHELYMIHICTCACLCVFVCMCREHDTTSDRVQSAHHYSFCKNQFSDMQRHRFTKLESIISCTKHSYRISGAHAPELHTSSDIDTRRAHVCALRGQLNLFSLHTQVMTGEHVLYCPARCWIKMRAKRAG